MSDNQTTSCVAQTTSCVASRRVASRRVASRRVASRRVASRRVASRRVASRRVASRRVASRRVASRYVPSLHRCTTSTSRHCRHHMPESWYYQRHMISTNHTLKDKDPFTRADLYRSQAVASSVWHFSFLFLHPCIN